MLRSEATLSLDAPEASGPATTQNAGWRPPCSRLNLLGALVPSLKQVRSLWREPRRREVGVAIDVLIASHWKAIRIAAVQSHLPVER
jgi:hypothetical protein